MRAGTPDEGAEGGGPRPRIAVTLGDPRGVGPEVVARAISDPRVAAAATFVLIGPDGVEPPAGVPGWPESAAFESVGKWRGREGEVEAAGDLSARAVIRGVELALSGRVDGLVTAPISKAAWAAAGFDYPGHTELLCERTGAGDVTMIMAAETTLLGGPLRVALLTTHLPLRRVGDALDVALVVRRSTIAAGALREWWGIPTPRLAFAGVNPHASEEGLFGDEEARILEPAAARIETSGAARVAGIFPADSVFRLCLEGKVDAVVVPYHDVGLAVLKTIAGGAGVNVTAGLPFPRTSPDHGTAFDIAGTGTADASSMKEALRLCARFCRRRVEGDAP